MRLVTFQQMAAVKSLFENGFLEYDPKYSLLSKYQMAYDFIKKEMEKQVEKKNKTMYPIWCWVKCYNFICPPKWKGKRVEGFDVKITFNKDVSDVFVTDFKRYSFVLNNKYIPSSREDYLNSLKVFKTEDEIYDSFKRCITNDSDILQGCVWRIELSDIEKIEFLPDDGYVYGSVNYVRSNGKRMDWIKDFYSGL